jgi:hypothetical protein
VKKLTIFVLFAGWLTAASAVNAQNSGTIVGQVRNQATMMVPSQAYVAVEGVNISTLTDIRGNYSLSLPPGRYQLTSPATSANASRCVPASAWATMSRSQQPHPIQPQQNPSRHG